MPKLRVLVADDSPTVRQRLVDALASDPEIELVGEAEDGKRAIELCQLHRPDMITMDMMMPVMTGLTATEIIMAYQPTPILIVSASINRGELFQIYEALAAGAVDVLEKPTGEEPDGVWEQRLISAVKLVARIKVITHPRARLDLRRERSLPGGGSPDQAQTPSSFFEAFGVGASTGGPSAIVDVLSRLPQVCQTPILVVLHMNEPFGSGFVDWLGAQLDRPVIIPRDGALVTSIRGHVAVAPCGKHLIVRNGRMFVTQDVERHSCRPSVDVLFESLAAYGASAAACLLTGMGRDGALGLLKIRQAGGVTIAQDEATCVVYGMPREAVLLGAATHVLPLGEIGARLASLRDVTMAAAQ